ncbi:MAG: hypothetical protein JSW72_01475, partial [Candidatus Bathyarchaeota archaeon]
MVKPRLLAVCLLILALPFGIRAAGAQSLVYHLEHEWVRVWINKDRTIDLLYDVRIVCDSGELHWVEVGQPNQYFTIGEAFDENNNELAIIDTSTQDDYKVRVDLIDLNGGESVRFNLTTNVGKMLTEDKTNPGNVGMKFPPSWYPVRIDNLRVRIVTPAGVNQSNLKTLTGMPWHSSDYDDGPFAVFWEYFSIPPNQEYMFGISFPEQFVEYYEIQPNWLEIYGPWIAFFAIFLLITTLVGVALHKKAYLKPVLSIETLGIKRGLTAVEASYLLDKSPNIIVTEILYSLLQKRAVWITATKPSVTLRVMEPFKSRRPSELEGTTLRY